MSFRLTLLLVLVIIAAGIFLTVTRNPNRLISPLGKPAPTEKPLKKYSFESLRGRKYQGSRITIDKILKDDDRFTSYLFFFTTGGKRVSGLMNVPKNGSNLPVMVLIRGYVDQTIYTTGEGTRRVGEEFANQGFLTLAPDFLGYGSSDKPSSNAMEERFQTYTTILDLLESIKTVNEALEKQNLPLAKTESVGIWGHSNGGQIALSILEITGKKYPTILWAPVSKPFPYSILYYTDDVDDHGKALRKLVSRFEAEYDSELYSLINYFDWIKAPLQLHQGTGDEAIPQAWSDTLYNTLKEKKIPVAYYTYPGENHNFNNGGWQTAFDRGVSFVKKELGLVQ